MKPIVVVDDNEQNLALQKDLLEIAGYQVFIASNATDGIALIKQVRPVIILMDMRLPDLNGTDAIKLLRLDDSMRDIPVVFVTASVMASDIEKMTAIPNSSFMSKPIDTRSFTNEIGKLINQADPLSLTAATAG